MTAQPNILDALRETIEKYHTSMRWDSVRGQHRDPFISWYGQSAVNKDSDLHLRVLLILTNARFDQGTRAERALENTQRLFKAGILTAGEVEIEQVPALNTRQRMNAGRWRELFWRSLPHLRKLSAQIAGHENWKASELLGAIKSAKIPYFGPKTARLAVRWISELVPEISVDMSDSEVPVDSLVYRVAARLGLLDPYRERYWGPGSSGHERVQTVARQLFPHNPSLMDEPIWMMGRQPRDGGFCSPTNPSCGRGCLFASFCPKLMQQCDPASIGYSAPTPRPISGLPIVHRPGSASLPCSRVVHTESPTPATAVPGLLVIISCVKKKVWDMNSSAPSRYPADLAYVSSYFSKNREYAQTFGECWCVLSAKFGFLMPGDEIENYNVTFNHGTAELVTVELLKEQIITKGLNRFVDIQVLGGSEYVHRVLAAFADTGSIVTAPLKGLRIGQAMQKVQRAITSQSAL